MEPCRRLGNTQVLTRYITTMSSGTNPGVSRLAESTIAKRKFGKGEPGRGMACSGCRAKKQRCDRKKPSCSTCIIAFESCHYNKRKPHTTAAELEDILQRLQHQYSHLKAKKQKIRHDQVPVEYSNSGIGGMTNSGSVSLQSAELRSMWLHQSSPPEPIASGSGAILQDEPFVDESFLTMPSRPKPSQRVSSRSIQSQPSGGNWSLSTDWSSFTPQHPIRVFTPVGRLGPSTIPGISRPNFMQEYVPVPTSHAGDQANSCSTPGPYQEQIVGQHQLNPTHRQIGQYDSSHGRVVDVAGRTILPHRQQPWVTTTNEPYGIIREPSLTFSRATWWDCLLQTYTVRPSVRSDFSLSSRHDTARDISQDVCTFFRHATIWLHFINVPLFFDMFHHPEYRSSIQPAFVLGILAYSKMLQSNRYGIKDARDAELRDEMWRQSVVLRDLAQAAFDASYNAGWIDLPLAQASWILVLYETSSHRNASMQRKESAVTNLDNLIRALGYTAIDAMDPRAPTFAPRAVPILGRPGFFNRTSTLSGATPPNADHPASPGSTKYQATRPSTPFDLYRSQGTDSTTHSPGTSAGCPCRALSLADNPETARSTPAWLPMPRWKSDASWAEIQREEARRLVWSSIVLLGADAAVRLADGHRQLDLHISKAENYALLYPGEEVYASLSDEKARHAGKESTWAILGRTMLLWMICVRQLFEGRMQQTHPPSQSPVPLWSNLTAGGTHDSNVEHDKRDEHVDFAMTLWMETLALEDALNAHSCNTEEATFWQARDYLFSIRLLVSGGFRHYIPVPRSGVNFAQLLGDNATTWLQGTEYLGARFRHAIMNEDARTLAIRNVFAHRPFLLSILYFKVWRTIAVWRLDHTQTFAIDVALGFREPLRWFEQVWPSSEEKRRRAALMRDLEQICVLLGKQMI
ncbi:hypothetical protein FRB94_001763 [Tulasnella sp. JGI-2019a]|nr:hypothetical protein FRB94_001763 [Tulasnella sp. JGI-2019a]